MGWSGVDECEWVWVGVEDLREYEGEWEEPQDGWEVRGETGKDWKIKESVQGKE